MRKKKRGRKRGKGLLKLEHRSFWVVLGMAFMLSVFTILSLINPDNLTGHATVQNVVYAKGGTNLFFEVRNIEGLQYADIKLLDTIKEGQITFDDEAAIDFDGKTFNSFKVSSIDSSKFGSVTYTLKIKNSDLLEAGINLNEIKLYVNDKEIPTVKTSTEGEHTFYTAKSEKFEEGDYVIGLAAVKVEKVAAEEPETKDIEKEPIEEEVTEEGDQRGALAGKAIQPSESKEGFFTKMTEFLRNIFG